MAHWRLIMVALLLAGLAAACAPHGARDYYVREDVDFSYVKRVAVLPFENLSVDKTAGEKVRRMFACELLASGLVDVASLGETTAAFERLRLDSPGELKPEDAKAICQAVGAQAVISGTVSRHEEVKAGSLSVPEVAVTFSMVDETGTTIWSSNVVKSGGGFWSYYLGGRGESVTEVSLQAIRSAIGTLRH
jgi:TolB-like protein